MKRRYSTEQADFLKAYIPGHYHAETAEAFNRRFPDSQVTADQVHAWATRHGVRSGRKARGCVSKYSTEVRDFIAKNYKGRSTKELHQMIVNRFGPVISQNNLKFYKKNHKLKSGLTRGYQKGHVPENKGKTWNEFMPKEAQERIRENWFKKGSVPHNHKPVGTVVMTTDGYLKRKIREPNVWEFVHRAEYEKHYGPIPDGMGVMFKDGNHENCAISNLALISKAENAQLNRRHLRFEDPELTESGVLVAKILALSVERKRRGGKRRNEKEEKQCMTKG